MITRGHLVISLQVMKRKVLGTMGASPEVTSPSLTKLSTALRYRASRWTALTLVPIPSPAHLLILPSSSLTNVFRASNGAAEFIQFINSVFRCLKLI